MEKRCRFCGYMKPENHYKIQKTGKVNSTCLDCTQKAHDDKIKLHDFVLPEKKECKKCKQMLDISQFKVRKTGPCKNCHLCNLNILAYKKAWDDKVGNYETTQKE
jgi:hypothetical protein